SAREDLDSLVGDRHHVLDVVPSVVWLDVRRLDAHDHPGLELDVDTRSELEALVHRKADAVTEGRPGMGQTDLGELVEPLREDLARCDSGPDPIEQLAMDREEPFV